MPPYAVRFVSLLLGLLAAPRALTIVETGGIAGHVREAASGRPLVGATIELVGKHWRTVARDSGSFSFTRIPEGRYTVRAVMIGYRSVEDTIHVRANATTTIELMMVPDPIRLEAVVVTGTVSRGQKSRSASVLNGFAAMPAQAYESDALAVGPGARFDSSQAWRYRLPKDREQYDEIVENQFIAVAADPLSTFSIDVDRASYSNMRRFIMQDGQLPPRDAVRIEELVNYFPYDYAEPDGDDPIAIHTEVAPAPWKPGDGQ